MPRVVARKRGAPVGVTYRGTPDGTVKVGRRNLDPRLDLRRHSPTGFAWGYGGSGPAQLALAILCHHLEDDNLATMLYQTFKWRVVSQFERGKGWTLTSAEVQAAVDAILDDRDRAIRHHPAYTEQEA